MLMQSSTEPLLRVRDLVIEFKIRGRRDRFRAVDGISLDVKAGTTFGIVGESGSGKTTVGRAILGLTPIESGSIELDGKSITDISRQERRRVARDVQVVFQDPYSSLNPSLTIGETLAEPLLVQGVTKREAAIAVGELLDQVALPRIAASRLPREFSGGQRQRIAIARALAMRPRLIICDEPVSALDLSTQARILDLLLRLQQETGVAYLFISHDLDVVRHLSHDIAVMQRGQVMEEGKADEVIGNPQHPYTRRLLAAAPVADPDEQAKRREMRRAMQNAEDATAKARN
jgi:ABC-type glutathione transport system ATPase component